MTDTRTRGARPIAFFLAQLREKKARLASAISWRLIFVLLPMQVPLIGGAMVSALSEEPVTLYGYTIPTVPPQEAAFYGALALFAIALLTCVVSYCQQISTQKLTRSMVTALRHKVAAAAAPTCPATEHFGSVEVSDRLVYDTEQIVEFTNRVCIQAVVNVVRVAFPVSMLFLIDVRIGIIATGILVPQILISRTLLRRLHLQSRVARDARTGLTGSLRDRLDTEADEDSDEPLEKVQDCINLLEREQLRTRRIAALNRANVWLFTSLGVALIWIDGMHRIMADALTVGQLVAATGLLAFVYQPLRQFSSIANVYKGGLVSLERIAEIVSFPADDDPEAAAERGHASKPRSLVSARASEAG